MRSFIRNQVPTDGLLLAFACVLIGAVLLAITVAGAFTGDEAHYLASIIALRGGTFRLEQTAGLSASRELLSFGAINFFEVVPTTPAAPVVPPLYAFFALPFSYIGWRGLTLINTAAFLATGCMVFALTKRYATRRRSPWLALALYWFGSYTLEYAVGMWPHCLAVMLCTGALLLVDRATDRGAPGLAAAAGLLAGLATGVRYQDVLYGGLLGVVLVVWIVALPRTDDDPSPLVTRLRRGATHLAAYVLGGALPLALASYVNHARLGSWNPVSKGAGYVALESSRDAAATTSMLVDWLRTFATKVVDFSLAPSFAQVQGGENYRPSAVSGAVVYGGVVKKAWLQSAPWLMLALLGFLLAWRGMNGLPERARRELRGMSIVVFGVLAAFAVAGAKRTEGFCFNMRYFLELMPIAAVATVWLVERFSTSKRVLGIATMCGALPLLSALALRSDSPVRHLIILRAPLVLASFLAVAALHARRTEKARWLGPALAACVSWSVFAHIADDLFASLKIRARHEYYKDIVEPLLPEDRIALFAYWSATIPFAPLTLDHDMILVDPFLDGGGTARPLADELLAKGWRVLVLPQKMPASISRSLLEGRMVTRLTANNLLLLEVHP